LPIHLFIVVAPKQTSESNLQGAKGRTERFNQQSTKDGKNGQPYHHICNDAPRDVNQSSSAATSCTYNTTVENSNRHSVRSKNNGAFRLLFLGGRFTRLFPESNCAYDVLFGRSKFAPNTAFNGKNIADCAVLCSALSGCF
jgi:hypothetical protein